MVQVTYDQSQQLLSKSNKTKGRIFPMVLSPNLRTLSHTPKFAFGREFHLTWHSGHFVCPCEEWTLWTQLTVSSLSVKSVSCEVTGHLHPTKMIAAWTSRASLPFPFVLFLVKVLITFVSLFNVGTFISYFHLQLGGQFFAFSFSLSTLTRTVASEDKITFSPLNRTD